MTFDPTKPVQTRDGRKARIICTDKGGAYSMVSLIESSGGEEFTHVHNKNGESCTSCDEQDLISIPEKRWAIIWRVGGEYGVLVTTTELILPEVKRTAGAIACLPFTEGQGLDGETT